MARKGTPPPGRRATKPPVDTGTGGTGGTEGTEDCPEEVEVVGRAAKPPSVGDDAELTLADDQPQLVIDRQVADILSTGPPLDVITRCLQLRETYLGEVTAVWPDRFEAILTRRSLGAQGAGARGR